MKPQLEKRFKNIIGEAINMVERCILVKDYLTGAFDYVSIYAQSPEDYQEVTDQLKALGTVALNHETGDYYKLFVPLVFDGKQTQFCRVRRFDRDHAEQGYVDFEVVNYVAFKKKCIGNNGFMVISSEDNEEMIELRDAGSSVRVYFLSNPF